MAKCINTKGNTRRPVIEVIEGGISKYNGNMYQCNSLVNDAGIKVTVHTPENATNTQQKINRIYDILKPVNA